MQGQEKRRDVEKERYCLPEGHGQGRTVVGVLEEGC